MGTRANILIIQGGFPKKVYFERINSGSPDQILLELINFCEKQYYNGKLYDRTMSDNIISLMVDLGLEVSQVGNFSYQYEIDLIKGTLRVWNSKTRWITAPADWQERGWNCHFNGKSYGYTTWCKNKRLFNIDISKLDNLKDWQDKLIESRSLVRK